jgi:hypothetical protein
MSQGSSGSIVAEQQWASRAMDMAVIANCEGCDLLSQPEIRLA